MSKRTPQFLCLALSMLSLGACQTPPGETATTEGGVTTDGNEVLDIRVLSEAEVFSGSGSRITRSDIPDILYEALQALNADRLLTPIDDNAHARFKRVLAIDPQNQIALEGLQDIVERYLVLAQQSMRRGQFVEAGELLERARFVDAEHPEIEAVAEALKRELDSDDLFFELDYPAYVAHSEAAVQELQEVARQAREHEAFFLITAPNDALARWMVSVMREAVSGYRLRGNIELSSRLGIRLRMPSDE